MTEVVKGRVGAVADYQSRDYFNIAVGDPEDDNNWFIGSDSTDVEEGDKVKVEYVDDNQVQNIDILEESDKEDGPKQGRDGSDARSHREGRSDTGRKDSSPNPKRANIQATAATKKAAEIVAKHRTTEPGEFEEEVSVVASGLNRIMDKLYEENMQ